MVHSSPVPTQLAFDFNERKQIKAKIEFKGIFLVIISDYIDEISFILNNYNLPYDTRESEIFIRLRYLELIRNLDFLEVYSHNWDIIKKLIYFSRNNIYPSIQFTSKSEIAISVGEENLKQIYFLPINMTDVICFAGIKFTMDYQIEKYIEENVIKFMILGTAKKSKGTHWEIELQSPNFVKYLNLLGLFMIDKYTAGLPNSLTYQLKNEKKIDIETDSIIIKPLDSIDKIVLNKACLYVGSFYYDLKKLIERKCGTYLVIVDEFKLLEWGIIIEKLKTSLNGSKIMIETTNNFNFNENIVADFVIFDSTRFDYINKNVDVFLYNNENSTLIILADYIEEYLLELIKKIKKTEFIGLDSKESITLLSQSNHNSHIREYICYSQVNFSVNTELVKSNVSYNSVAKYLLESKDYSAINHLLYEGVNEYINPIILNILSDPKINNNDLLIVGNEEMRKILLTINQDWNVSCYNNELDIRFYENIYVIGYSEQIDLLKKKLSDYDGSITIKLLDLELYIKYFIDIENFYKNNLLVEMGSYNILNFYKSLV